MDSAAEADAALTMVPEARRSRVFAGRTEHIAERIQATVLAAGVDGVIANAPLNGHVPGVVTALGQALAPLVVEDACVPQYQPLD